VPPRCNRGVSALNDSIHEPGLRLTPTESARTCRRLSTKRSWAPLPASAVGCSWFSRLTTGRDRELDAPLRGPILPSKSVEDRHFPGHFNAPSLVATLAPKAKSVCDGRPSENAALRGRLGAPVIRAGPEPTIASGRADRLQRRNGPVCRESLPYLNQVSGRPYPFYQVPLPCCSLRSDKPMHRAVAFHASVDQTDARNADLSQKAKHRGAIVQGLGILTEKKHRSLLGLFFSKTPERL